LTHIKGVVGAEFNPYQMKVTVSYDETQTDIDTIVKSLSNGGFSPIGKPKFLN
jgi:hypothetical protein